MPEPTTASTIPADPETSLPSTEPQHAALPRVPLWAVAVAWLLPLAVLALVFALVVAPRIWSDDATACREYEAGFALLLDAAAETGTSDKAELAEVSHHFATAAESATTAELADAMGASNLSWQGALENSDDAYFAFLFNSLQVSMACEAAGVPISIEPEG